MAVHIIPCKKVRDSSFSITEGSKNEITSAGKVILLVGLDIIDALLDVFIRNLIEKGNRNVFVRKTTV